MNRQILLIVEWLRVGFIHGVMNTDNMAISGETIDYGPCAFMDNYNPNSVFSSIDRMGRYAFANQPPIVQWNIEQFAEAILPLLHDEIEEAASIADQVMQSFGGLFQKSLLSMMRKKLGFFGQEKEDAVIIGGFLKWMQKYEADYTNTFRYISSNAPPKNNLYENDEFKHWYAQWQDRLKRNNKPIASSICLMRANNPAFIPRNHHVESALSAAEEHSDFSKLHELLDVLSEPYEDKPEYVAFTNPPKPEERVLQTFCGT